MEEDEDVILEGTSLHQYLQEVGFTDFEVISSQNRSNELMKNVSELDKNKKNTRKNDATLIRDVIHKILGLANAEDLLLESLGLKIISTRLLEEEDLLILETLSPSIERLSSAPELIHNSGLKERLTESIFFTEYSSPSSATFYLWSSIIALMLSLNLVGDFTHLHCLCMLGVVLFAVFYVRYFYLSKYELCRIELEKTLSIIERSNYVSRRCLKFLNELNILRKGLGRKISLLDMSESRYENALSEGVWGLLDSLSSALKSGHSQLLGSKMCSSQNIDSLFSNRFDSNESPIDEEDLSYPSLKTKRNVTAVQTSSFLAELFLYFELSRNTSVFRLIPQTKYDLIKTKAEWLEGMLRLSLKAWLDEESALKSIVHPQKNYEKLKWDVTGAVDVLSVRCRIIAYSGTYLKEALAQDLGKEKEHVIYDTIQKACEDIRNELVSCDACLEEVLDRSRNFYGQSRENDHPTSMKLSEDLENRSDTSSPDPDVTRVQVCGLEERVIEDEVFETIIEHDEMRKTKTDGDEAWLQSFKAEKRIKKKQKDRCKRVLQEIQPILQKRREMWLDRESKALKRMELDQKGRQVESNLQLSPISNDSGLSSPAQGVVSVFETFSPRNLPVMVLSDDIDQKSSEIDTLPKGVAADKKSGTTVITTKGATLKENEYDSEEERLLLYKKLRKELDEDEAMRQDESEDEKDEGDTESERDDENIQKSSVTSRKMFQLHLSSVKGIGRAGKSTAIVDSIQSVYHASHGIPVEQEENDGAVIYPAFYDTNKKSWIRPENEDVDPLKYAPFAENSNASPSNASFDFGPAKSPKGGESLVVDYSNPGIISLTSELSSPSPELSKSSISLASLKERENECFSCGDIGEEDERVLDWAQCGFTKNRETVREIGFCGLPSLLTSKAHRSGPLVGGVEEVFGGVGEGASESESESEEESEDSDKENRDASFQ